MFDPGNEGGGAMKPDQVYELWVRITPERLWAALTDGERTRQYFHETRIESDWRPGSPVIYCMEDGRVAVEGEVLECEPGRRLSITWGVRYNEQMAREEPSRVTFQIEEFGAMCLLRVTHDRFPPASEVADHVAGGWMAILSNLKTLLETGQPLGIS